MADETKAEQNCSIFLAALAAEGLSRHIRMNVLVFNVGSASLKFQVISMPLDAAFPEQGRTMVSGAVEEFGAEAIISFLCSKTRKSCIRKR